ncbi:hypothetical protein BU25DRAFT_45868 [Macroventuria anomochaeta]|uniref:Uncharacterized protein n=1 Tax=Macroventuria anomochaeta TaxID=301207 RepID=A0ACB6S3D0_9PLEO|nr:uncharacterized protein BU25DRAFT_45868 [Macroventuria anomochaeta]KAF2627878.1 hypothetical protein BU25DRAFT_45868 [Macroventuria anomochaeta]
MLCMKSFKTVICLRTCQLLSDTVRLQMNTQLLTVFTIQNYNSNSHHAAPRFSPAQLQSPQRSPRQRATGSPHAACISQPSKTGPRVITAARKQAAHSRTIGGLRAVFQHLSKSPLDNESKAETPSRWALAVELCGDEEEMGWGADTVTACFTRRIG